MPPRNTNSISDIHNPILRRVPVSRPHLLTGATTFNPMPTVGYPTSVPDYSGTCTAYHWHMYRYTDEISRFTGNQSTHLPGMWCIMIRKNRTETPKYEEDGTDTGNCLQGEAFGSDVSFTLRRSGQPLNPRDNSERNRQAIPMSMNERTCATCLAGRGCHL